MFNVEMIGNFLFFYYMTLVAVLLGCGVWCFGVRPLLLLMVSGLAVLGRWVIRPLVRWGVR